MDAGKRRKRDREGGGEGKRAKVAEKDHETLTEEEEVEEFFTILRRIHEAAKHFGKTDGDAGKKLTASMKFELQDFAEDNGSLMNDQIHEEKKAEVDLGLDLNSLPLSEDS